jgi:hypothetical protein
MTLNNPFSSYFQQYTVQLIVQNHMTFSCLDFKKLCLGGKDPSE